MTRQVVETIFRRMEYTAVLTTEVVWLSSHPHAWIYRFVVQPSPVSLLQRCLMHQRNMQTEFALKGRKYV